jgi:tRNA A-37 threonylcarbamoyl transferase component Bud32
MESGVATVESPLRGSSPPTSPDSARFVPPEPASLAAHFPQLEIIELLGHGGMGAVYKARQKNLDRLVALKIIRPEAADTPAFAERFNREARMLARLNHPHIVSIYDFGEVSVSDPGGSPRPPRSLYFFLMEYVDGSSLRQQMRSGELTPQQALKVVPQICDALQYAHDEGIVHRDIKPENILLDKRGRVKIADFGLAKLAAPTTDDFTLTATHHVLGTVRYMAPEQMEGSHSVDHRADIYSLGVVFYEMLTREVPAGHFEPPSKKVEIDVRLDEIVLRALAREPERRYQHASDVKDEVESICKLLPAEKIATGSGEFKTRLQRLIAPAVGMLAIGSALIVWLALAIGGRLPSGFEDWWVVGLAAPLLLLGGFAMSGGRAYWLAFVASLACLSIGFASLYFIFIVPFVPLAALVVGGYSLWQLMQPEVVEAFQQQSRSGISFARRRLVITVTVVLPMLALVCAAPLFYASFRQQLAFRDAKTRVVDQDTTPVEAAPSLSMEVPGPPAPELGPEAPPTIVLRHGDVPSQSQDALDGEWFDFSLDANPGLWSASIDGIVLHPLPNRELAIGFNLTNRTKVNKTVDISFIVPDRIPSSDRLVNLSRGALQRAAAEAILKDFLKDFDDKSLMQTLTMELPASRESVRVRLTPLAGQRISDQANLLLPDQATAESFHGIEIPYGMIVVVRDLETDRWFLRRVVISPRQPRSYLKAIAEYDGTASLRIKVTATNHDLVPPEGIKLSAAFTGISEQLDSTREATLRAPTYEATLSGVVPPNAPEVINVTIDVDDYPRAFIFRIPRQTNSVVEPVTDAMDVRLEVQGEKRAFKAPDEKVPVILKVDAPYNTFGDGNEAYVEVGIDSDQDRLLADAGEQQWTLRSDRQVSVAATNFALNGTLTLETKISDFSLDLTTNARIRPVWVLSRLWAPPLEPVTSEPIEIKLDGAPPKIEEIRLPSSQIEVGKDLEITVFASDLSGVAKVEAIFETLSSGNAQGEKPAWEVAQPNNEGGWVANLKTDKLLPGTRHQVLVKATDEVGHVSEGRSDEVQVVAKPVEGSQTPEQQNLSKFVDVKGRVLYRGQALKSMVKFDPPLAPPIGPVETDDGGNFTIRRVPVGKHTLKARGRGGAYYRNAELVIEVTKDSENPLSVALEAK